MNLSDAVEAVEIKTLVPVDLPDYGPNQHEVGGVSALRDFFGTDAKVREDVQWRYLADDREPHALRFDSQAMTEGKNKPDFLFPDEDAYHDPGFPPDRLTMLGAKSTCKERWRQVLTE